MKLHEQRNLLVNTQEEILEDIQSNLEFLNSPKFQNGEDWIRTGEVQAMLACIRSKLQQALEE